MRTVPFLWEIGCEEIPADWLPDILDQLRARFTKHMETTGLNGITIEIYGTLRRLVVHVPNLPEKQPDRLEEITGPPARIARTEQGEWSQAALGFARKNGVDPWNLTILETPKGQYVGFVRRVMGQPAIKVLPSLMASTMRDLSFPKFMSWDAEIGDGRGAFPFGRPIRWMVCLLGNRVVPFEIRVGTEAVETGNRTRGHRFLAPKGSKPGAAFRVSSFRELEQGLKRHYVLLDPGARVARLEKLIENLEKRAGARRSPRLRGLSTRLLADLVEWPGAILGFYPEEFLSLPEDVCHTVLIHHQKYIPLEGKPAFIAVTNMAGDPKGHIRRGTERVVVARLRDAKFFWEEDLKAPLEARREALEGVLFHEKLGSYLRKVERIVRLSVWLAERCGIPTPPVERAAGLAKCDLTTGMVGEFPELQGVMGGLYAREQGESEEVWKAVYSHYRPAGLGEDEDFPLNREGVIISLADKLDTLGAMFAVGVVPTGSRDPFGLRRLALGVIRTLLEAEARLGLRIEMTSGELLDRALEEVNHQLRSAAVAVTDLIGEIPAQAVPLREFFVERLRFLFAREFRYDEVNAVFALGPLGFSPADLARRLSAVAALRGSADFDALSVAFKRVRNILAGEKPASVDPGAFVDEAERNLWSAFTAIEPEASGHIASRRYEEALRSLSRLRPQVDTFFDKVLVMAPEIRLRENRLALLGALDSEFSRVADLSEIVAGPKPETP